MCGIFGAYDWSGATPKGGREMAAALAHRGPNAEGMHEGPGILLGNRRLSIIDLSDASNQPLYAANGNLVVVQNGEIFNYVELRETLLRRGHVFETSGDTEVLLHAFAEWGPDFVTHLNGMFAIALYEVSERRLWLYRDRLGVKPLYVAGSPEDGTLWFASEIKSILTNGRSYGTNLDALAQFFALNYVPAPATMFDGIVHLPPGHRACLSPSGLKVERYWTLTDIAPDAAMDKGSAEAGFLTLLDDATRLRMRADAAFGAFLSGGLDSASVVGMMSLYQKSPIRTYSIGFDDPRFDESHWARMAATRFGTFHQTRVMPPDMANDWPRFIWHCDQPHGDVSFIPSDQVARLAAEDVRMVLTGDGGDELWGGYTKYLDLFPGGRTDHLTDGWEDGFVRASGLLQGDQADSLLAGGLREAFHDADPYRALSGAIRDSEGQDPINRVLMAETLTLLPGNNLVKPDRMAMANGLEVRSPYLDYRMAEFAFSVPGEMKLAGGETKAIAKSALKPFLGHDLTYRKKQMFTVPVGEWLKDGLSGFARDMLLDGRLGARGILREDGIERLLSEHVEGRANHTRILRALISVEIWHRLFVDRANLPVSGEAL